MQSLVIGGSSLVTLEGIDCRSSIDTSALSTLKKLLKSHQANAVDGLRPLFVLAACCDTVRDTIQRAGLSSPMQDAEPESPMHGECPLCQIDLFWLPSLARLNASIATANPGAPRVSQGVFHTSCVFVVRKKKRSRASFWCRFAGIPRDLTFDRNRATDEYSPQVEPREVR